MNRDKESDEQLMAELRQRACHRSFQQLFVRWREPIQRHSFRMLGNWQDAEDCVQAVFSKLFVKRDIYRAETSFAAFIWAVATNEARDAIRRRKRLAARECEVRPAGSTCAPENNHEIELAELSDEVHAAIQQLPEIYREVVLLRHFQDLPFKLVAEILDLPMGTVASRMAKALKLLARIFSERNGDDPNCDERNCDERNCDQPASIQGT